MTPGQAPAEIPYVGVSQAVLNALAAVTGQPWERVRPMKPAKESS